MKLKIATRVVLVALAAGPLTAEAACIQTGRLTGTVIATKVQGNYVCSVKNNNKWNELHTIVDATSGLVLDFKKGPLDPVDPSATPAHPTGTYSIAGGAGVGTITYTYGDPQGPYTYSVRPVGFSVTQFEFCNVSTFETFAITVGTAPTPNPVACP